MADNYIEPKVLKEMFLVAFGCLPVLDWNENWTMWEDHMGNPLDEPEVLRDFSLMIDTALLEKVGDFEYSYVGHLLVEVIQDKMRKPELKHFALSASRKYSFSDTETWWDDISIKGDVPEDRERFEVGVTIG